MNLVNPYVFTVPALTFVSTWKTDNLSSGSSTATQVKLPLVSQGTYNFTVNWGDGNSNTIAVWNQAEVTHTYSIAGTYTITITGVCTGWKFNASLDRLKILSISTWGCLRFITSVISTQGSGHAFYNCANLKLDTVSDILVLSGVKNLNDFFRGCTAITTINRINEWDFSSVEKMSLTFAINSNFNQTLNLNTTSVNNLYGLFTNDVKFNSTLNLTTNNVIEFREFLNGASLFNQSLATLNTSSATGMYQMFRNASKFNQSLSHLVTNNVTTMYQMFSGATDFNQDIGMLNVSNVVNFSGFMGGKTPATFSAANLDAIYNGWSSRPVQPNIVIDFGTAKYTASGAEGRLILTSAPNNWVITDGGI